MNTSRIAAHNLYWAFVAVAWSLTAHAARKPVTGHTLFAAITAKVVVGTLLFAALLFLAEGDRAGALGVDMFAPILDLSGDAR